MYAVELRLRKNSTPQNMSFVTENIREQGYYRSVNNTPD